MHRSDVRSLADCFWRPSPPSLSSPLCSAFCTDGACCRRGELKTSVPVDGQHPQRIDTMPADDTRNSKSDSTNLSPSARRKRRSWRPAALTATRNEDLLKTRSVSTQDRDNAEGTLAADKAIVQSNEGNVARLEQLQSYEKVSAPFDGIITARSTDTGALIDAGATSPSKELFHLAAIDTLRVYVAVPEPYSSAAQPGATASLTLDEFPSQSFHGRLVRNANAIDLSSRTLLVEVDVDNPSGRLLPGAYTSVHLSLPSAVQSLPAPPNPLLFRQEGFRTPAPRHRHPPLLPGTIG